MGRRVNSDLLLAGSLPADSGRTVGWLHLAGPRFGRQPGRDGTETMREHAGVARKVRAAG